MGKKDQQNFYLVKGINIKNSKCKLSYQNEDISYIVILTMLMIIYVKILNHSYKQGYVCEKSTHICILLWFAM